MRPSASSSCSPGSSCSPQKDPGPLHTRPQHNVKLHNQQQQHECLDSADTIQLSKLAMLIWVHRHIDDLMSSACRWRLTCWCLPLT